MKIVIANVVSQDNGSTLCNVRAAASDELEQMVIASVREWYREVVRLGGHATVIVRLEAPR